MTETPTLSRETERAAAIDIAEGQRLYHEKCAAYAAWKKNPSHETFNASSVAFAAWDDWCVNNLPALLTAARAENERLREGLAGEIARIRALPEDTFGYGHSDNGAWPLRDELADRLTTLAAASEKGEK